MTEPCRATKESGTGITVTGTGTKKMYTGKPVLVAVNGNADASKPDFEAFDSVVVRRGCTIVSHVMDPNS